MLTIKQYFANLSMDYAKIIGAGNYILPKNLISFIKAAVRKDFEIRC